MVERFMGSEPEDLLSPDERRALTNLAEDINTRRSGPLAVEGINKSGEDISGLTFPPSVHPILENAEETVRITRHALRLFANRHHVQTVSEEKSRFSPKQAAQIAGITVLSVAGGTIFTEAVALVVFGATVAQAWPIMAIAGAVMGVVGFLESRKALIGTHGTR